MEVPTRRRVGVPETFHRLGPGGNLLNLIEHQQSPRPRPALRQPPGPFPLRFDPGGIMEARPVRARVMGDGAGIRNGLSREGGLARLSGSRQDLDESSGFSDATNERPQHRPPIRR